MEAINLDTFIEQLVVIKSTGKTKAIKIIMWILACLLSAGLILFAVLNTKMAFLLFSLVAVVFFVVKLLTGQMNMEFEYILTNDEIDIDCIVNKKKRQRMATFKCNEIEKIEKYDKNRHVSDKSTGINVYFACTPDEDSVAFSIKHPKKGIYIVVLSPNEQFIAGMKKFLSYNNKKFFN